MCNWNYFRSESKYHMHSICSQWVINVTSKIGNKNCHFSFRICLAFWDYLVLIRYLTDVTISLLVISHVPYDRRHQLWLTQISKKCFQSYSSIFRYKVREFTLMTALLIGFKNFKMPRSMDWMIKIWRSNSKTYQNRPQSFKRYVSSCSQSAFTSLLLLTWFIKRLEQIWMPKSARKYEQKQSFLHLHLFKYFYLIFTRLSEISKLLSNQEVWVGFFQTGLFTHIQNFSVFFWQQ